MGITKAEKFTKEQNELALMAKALAHPARIAIIEHLLKAEECFCGDIVEELPLSQSTVSQHLGELKKVGLIKGSIEGTSVCYCINEKAWKTIEAKLGNLFSSYCCGPKCC